MAAAPINGTASTQFYAQADGPTLVNIIALPLNKLNVFQGEDPAPLATPRMNCNPPKQAEW